MGILEVFQLLHSLIPLGTALVFMHLAEVFIQSSTMHPNTFLSVHIFRVVTHT